ncbi:efflux RND transporter periplasmic adaptor subunit [Vibrio albus]|uniref:efflux RND transporter periplasmic adaptor subunit n=1 Tax=Vibrio albus TaxID=2200953 RepID=UPI001FE788D9|nr:efflux RND transporter periplasmic adaptor subunit [Vibrio albus]
MSFLSGCYQANSEPQLEIIKPVKLYEVPANHPDGYDAFLAKVDAGTRSQLSFQVSGVIETLLVKEGQKVRKNDVLATLDATDFQLALEANQAQYDLAKINYERDRKLVEKQLISTDSFDKSETTYKAARAALEQAKTDLGYTTLKAPFDGVVSLSFAKQDQFIQGGAAVLNILTIDKLDVDFSLPVNYVKEIGVEKLKQRSFSVVLDHYADKVFPAHFKEISTSPDIDTNSYNATVSIIRPQNTNILAGMTGQVRLLNKGISSSLFLPEDALFYQINGQVLVWRYIPEQQVVQSTEIELSPSGAVIRGIEEGDLIVIAGADNLIEGQKVKAWKKEGGI